MTEDQLEQEALGRLQEGGYSVLHGPEIAPDSDHPERKDYRQVLLLDRLRSAIARLNPSIPPRRSGRCDQADSGPGGSGSARRQKTLPPTPRHRRPAENRDESHEQAQILAELRDTLLPRLISGKLRLPEAEEMIVEVF